MTTPKNTSTIKMVLIGIALLAFAGLAYRYTTLPTLNKVRVRVVDSAGQPVQGLWVHSRSSRRSETQGQTDAMGQVETAALQKHGLVARLLGLSLWIRFLGYKSPRIPLQEDMRVVVPECGSLELAIVRADGTPYEDPSLVHVGAQVAWTYELKPGSTILGSRYRKWGADGKVRYEHVALDANLQIGRAHV